MDIENDKTHKKQSFGKIILSIVVVGAIILTVLTLPARFQKYEDSKYCLGSQQKYEASYLGKYEYKTITDIYSPDITYITVGEGTDAGTFTSCSITPENSSSFTIKDVAVGNTIFKESFSNEFMILKGGKEYIFLVDKNAPELPSFD
jgi:hypothetical protein